MAVGARFSLYSHTLYLFFCDITAVETDLLTGCASAEPHNSVKPAQ